MIIKFNPYSILKRCILPILLLVIIVYTAYANHVVFSPDANETAAIKYSGDYKLIYSGSPFETIISEYVRNDIMGREINYFNNADPIPSPTHYSPGTVKNYMKISSTTEDFSDALTDNEWFGSSVANIGDLNGDGINDLAALSYNQDDFGRYTRGGLWVIFMNANGTIKSYRKTSNSYINLSISSAVTNLGDIDGDGIQDLAVGCHLDVGHAGTINILFLNRDGSIKNYHELTNPYPEGAHFGGSLTNIGDLNGDGIPELVSGIIGSDDGGNDRGAIVILYLDSDGSVKNTKKISSTDGNFTGQLMDNDHFGSSVANIGDLNNDGVNDLAVGASNDSDNGVQRGCVWILFMKNDGTVLSQQKINDKYGSFTGTLDDYDSWGGSIACIGDIDGDNIQDLAVGTSGSYFWSGWGDDDGGLDRGAIWILFMNPDGTVKNNQKISSIEGCFNGELDDRDLFGFSLAYLGDIDSDGIGDLAAGSLLDDDGGPDRGAVWLLNLNGIPVLYWDSVLTVDSNPILSTNLEYYRGAIDAPVMSISLENNNECDVVIDDLKIASSGTGNEQRHIIQASLYIDKDKNQILSSEDIALKSLSVPYLSNDGMMDFRRINLQMSAGTTETLLLCYDFINEQSDVAQDFTARIDSVKSYIKTLPGKNQTVNYQNNVGDKITLLPSLISTETIDENTPLSDSIALFTQKTYKIEPNECEGYVLRLSWDNTGTIVNLYARQGEIPTRTRYDYLICSTLSDNYIELPVPDTKNEQWNFMVYVTSSKENLFSYNFEVICAGKAYPYITSLSPEQIGNLGEELLTIEGVGLSENTYVELIDSKGKTYTGKNIMFTERKKLTSLINLLNANTGLADVRIKNNESSPLIINDSVNIVSGKGASLYSEIDSPDWVRPGREYVAWIKYGNRGDSDMMAPVFVLESLTHTPMSLSDDKNYIDEPVQVLGISPSAPAGILKAGEENKIPVYFYANGTSTFELSVITAKDTALDGQYWTTWFDYISAMIETSTRINLRGDIEYRIDKFHSFETMRIDGDNICSISGELRHALTGERLSGYNISAVSDGDINSIGSDITDIQGHFQIEYLAGNANFKIGVEGANLIYPSGISIQNSTDVNNVIIFALPLGKVSGYVTDKESGLPISGIEIRAIGESAGLGSATTDSNGKYEITNLEWGTYTVEVESRDYYIKDTLKDISVKNEHPVSGVNFSLSVGGGIYGTITETQSGDKITSATVVVTDSQGEIYTENSDANGNYEIKGISEGKISLKVISDQHTIEDGTELYINKSQSLLNNINLSLGASISGIVKSNNTPYSFAGVNATDQKNSFYSSICNSNGEYKIQGLKIGTYLLTAITDDNSSKSISISITTSMQTLTGVNFYIDVKKEKLLSQNSLNNDGKLGYLLGNNKIQDNQTKTFAEPVAMAYFLYDIFKFKLWLMNNDLNKYAKSKPQGEFNCAKNWDTYRQWLGYKAKAESYRYSLVANQSTFQSIIFQVQAIECGIIAWGCYQTACAIISKNPVGAIVLYLGSVIQIGWDAYHGKFDCLGSINSIFINKYEIALEIAELKKAAEALGIIGEVIEISIKVLEEAPKLLDVLKSLYELAIQAGKNYDNYNQAFNNMLFFYYKPYTSCPTPTPIPPPCPNCNGGNGQGGGRDQSGSDTSNAIIAKDPNEKVGTAGAGNPDTERYVAAGQKLEYIIYFENKSTATAPAQEISISDKLDSNLDWNTFQLGEICLGTKLYYKQVGKATFAFEEQITSNTLNAQISANINYETGEAVWNMRSVDPLTSDFPENPFLGLLPPNDSTNIGEGYVKYTVNIKSACSAWTRITNTSTIVFDYESPIETNQVFNNVYPGLPSVPDNPYPENQSDNVYADTILRVSSCSYALNYDLYLWQEGQPKPVTPTIINLPVPSFDPPGNLESLKKYNWQIVARNYLGSAESPIWTFNTNDNFEKYMNKILVGYLLGIKKVSSVELNEMDINRNGEVDISDIISFVNN